MQTWSIDENSVRPSVRLANACIVTKLKKNLSRSLYHTKDYLAYFSQKKNVWWGVGDPFYLKFGSTSSVRAKSPILNR